jgi:hypothetical protein
MLARQDAGEYIFIGDKKKRSQIKSVASEEHRREAA